VQPYSYELKLVDGSPVLDERPESHPTEQAAIAYGKRVARELARNNTKASGSIIVRNGTGKVLAEIPLVYVAALGIAS